MALRAALMNDTGGCAHFDRPAMRVITSNLTIRGVSISGRSRVGNKWWADVPFLNAAGPADIFVLTAKVPVITAGSRAEHILRVVDHAVAANKPVVQINAIHQANPAEWRRYLDKFALIAPRDCSMPPRSAI